MVIFNPSSQAITVNVLDVSVNTIITLTQDPPGDVPSGVGVAIHVNLSRADTGAGIPGVTILGYRDGGLMPPRTTDSNGNVRQGLGAMTPGSHTYEARFQGATVAGLTFGPSSARISTRVGILDLGSMIIPAIVVGAAALFYLGRRG